MIKTKSKEWLSDLEKFKVQAILVLYYKKRNDSQIASDLDIDEAFKFMHQSKTKIRNWNNKKLEK